MASRTSGRSWPKVPTETPVDLQALWTGKTEHGRGQSLPLRATACAIILANPDVTNEALAELVTRATGRRVTRQRVSLYQSHMRADLDDMDQRYGADVPRRVLNYDGLCARLEKGRRPNGGLGKPKNRRAKP